MSNAENRPAEGESAAPNEAGTGGKEVPDFLTGKFREEVFNPLIAPTDTDWLQAYDSFRARLQSKALIEVMKLFDQEQYYLLMPTVKNNVILKIHLRSATAYKKALKTRFKGTNDNMITKMTMLWFGLPIEPLTVTNVNNARKDEKDPEDPKTEESRLQRIIFAEKPLEFLDYYYERSYGFPKLHMKKPQKAPRQVVVVNSEDMHLPPRRRAPVVPQGSVSLRGGAGSSQKLIYSHYNGKAHVDSAKSFKEAALRMLGLDKDSNWHFVVEMYSNEDSRGDTMRPDDVSGRKPLENVSITKDNFEAEYQNYLEPRLFDEERIIMVVTKSGEKAKANFVPPIITGWGNPPSKATTKSNRCGSGSDSSSKLWVYGIEDPTLRLPVHVPNATDPFPPRFTHTVNKLLGLDLNESTLVDIFMYSGGEDVTTKKFFDSFTWQTQTPSWELENKIVGKLWANDFKWTFVVSKHGTHKAPTFWPPSSTIASQPTPSRPSVPGQTPGSGSSSSATPRRPASVPGQTPGSRTSRSQSSPTNTGKATTATSKKVGEDLQGYLYGYAGKLKIDETQENFIERARRVLNLNLEFEWAFEFDLYSPITAGKLDRTGTVTKATWDDVWKSEIQPALNYLNPIFVRLVGSTRYPEASNLQPTDNRKDIIEIRSKDGVSWWKLPNQDKLSDFGINQIQNSFCRAIRLHQPATRDIENVLVHNVNLGYGGMEVTNQLWDTLKDELTNLVNTGENRLKFFKTNANYQGEIVGKVVGIRMAGNCHYGHFQPGNHKMFVDDINYLTTTFTTGGKIPESGRYYLWRSATERERGGGSGDNIYDKEAALAKLKDPQDSLRKILDDKDTTCVWFRPEFNKFYIRNAGKDKDVEWNATARHNQTLASFKAMLQGLDSTENWDYFEITESEVRSSGSTENKYRFVITPSTTEDDWRKNVFDWFNDDHLIVKHIKKIEYVEDTTDHFGVAEVAVKMPRPKPTNQASQGVGIQGTTQATTPGTAQVPAQIPAPVLAHNLNKERLIRPVVEEPAIEEWDVWQENRIRASNQKRGALTQDQSVFTPGQKPEAPQFGPSREINISISSNMPDFFTEPQTATDIQQIAEYSKILEASNLERILTCQMCSKTFEGWEDDAKQQHLNHHIRALKENEFCFFCEQPWSTFTTFMKKTHLSTHAQNVPGGSVGSGFQDFTCPICNQSFRNFNVQNVLYHMADHPSGILNHCDRCSLQLTLCTPAEIEHHARVCGEGPVPWFCPRCGRDQGPSEEQQNRHHRNCTKEGQFHPRCGINQQTLPDILLHQHISRCTIPRGPPGNFCKLCGRHLSVMTPAQQANHSRTCLANQLRVKGSAERRNQELSQWDNRLNNKDQELRTKEANLRYREAQLKRGTTAGITQRTEQEEQDQIRRYDDLADRYDDLADTVEGLRKLYMEDLGTCPFKKCGADIGNYNRAALFDHVEKYHIEGTCNFHCPLMNRDGQECNMRINVAGDLMDIRAHYRHREDGEEDGINIPEGGGVSQNMAEAFLQRLLQLSHGSDGLVNVVGEIEREIGNVRRRHPATTGGTKRGRENDVGDDRDPKRPHRDSGGKPPGGGSSGGPGPGRGGGGAPPPPGGDGSDDDDDDDRPRDSRGPPPPSSPPPINKDDKPEQPVEPTPVRSPRQPPGGDAGNGPDIGTGFRRSARKLVNNPYTPRNKRNVSWDDEEELELDELRTSRSTRASSGKFLQVAEIVVSGAGTTGRRTRRR